MFKSNKVKLMMIILAFVMASLACADLNADLSDVRYNPETFEAEYDSEGNEYCPRSAWESTPTPDEQEFYQNRD